MRDVPADQDIPRDCLFGPPKDVEPRARPGDVPAQLLDLAATLERREREIRPLRELVVVIDDLDLVGAYASMPAVGSPLRPAGIPSVGQLAARLPWSADLRFHLVVASTAATARLGLDPTVSHLRAAAATEIVLAAPTTRAGYATRPAVPGRGRLERPGHPARTVQCFVDGDR